MGLKLEQIVPWGRSFEEYTQMFDLSSADLQCRILDVAGGPASFNAQMNQQGYPIVSCDPLYQFTAPEIAQRIQAVYPAIVEGTRANRDQYVWQKIRSPEALGQVRMAAMQRFLEDFRRGKPAGRYLDESLPDLPFATAQFDLALCSHFLFTYSDHLSLEFHLAAIQEMGRVATELRIFPLLNISGEPSPFLTPVVEQLQLQGYSFEIRTVPYEFQKGGNQLLKIWRA